MGKQVNCVKLGQMLEGLDAAPVPGELGQKVLDNVSKQAWEGWLQHQTMLINEHRLNLRDAEARQFLLTELEKYFFGDQ
jgi:Fe-S cluster biosynthesis and repair protein YggX